MNSTNTQAAPAAKGGVGKLDQFFQITQRGSTVGQEVKAGVSVCLVSVCALFMNLQIVTKAFSGSVSYCGLYLAATLTAFLGTLLLGLLCNLPLVQTASLSLSTVLISTLGAGTGLTYENLLAVSFVSAVLYLALMLAPPAKKLVYRLVPDSVRRALPVTLGLYVAYTALNNMGLLDGLALADLSNASQGGAAVAPYLRLCAMAGVITVAAVLLLKKRRVSVPMLNGLIWGLLVFFFIAAVGGDILFGYVFTQNRIWVGVNPDKLGEMYTIARGFRELELGAVFTRGFDFSAYTANGGNVAVLFLQGVLSFLFLGMYESEASVLGANTENQILPDNGYEAASGKFLLANAITNVAAPILGAAPVSVGKQSAVAAEDGGRTGLTSVVCAAGYLIAAFTWLPFALLSAYNASVPEYGHAGYVFPNVIQAGFQAVDGVMLLAGIGMLRGAKKLEGMSWDEMVSFGATVAVGAFSQNIAYGAAAGVVVFALVKLFTFALDEWKQVGVSTWVMAVLSAALLAMVLMGAAKGAGGSGAQGGDDPGAAAESAVLTLDTSSGSFSFQGASGVDYYCVWVYGADENGEAVGDYLAASKRLSGEGEITGEVDLSALPFGGYVAKAIPFLESGAAQVSTPTARFSITGTLSTPEFKASADGTAVTVSVDSDTMSAYYTSELFHQLTIRVYDAAGTEVATDTIVADEVVYTPGWGPNPGSYAAEKTLTLDAGSYELAVTADGDGSYAASSPESDRVALTIAAGEAVEAATSGYVEAQGGMDGPGGFPGGDMGGPGGEPGGEMGENPDAGEGAPGGDAPQPGAEGGLPGDMGTGPEAEPEHS